MSEATARRQSEVVRCYIKAVVDAGVADGRRFESQDAMDAWVLWAHRQADRLDPLVESPHSILDENPDELWDDTYA